MILSPPQYAASKLPLDILLHYKCFLTPKFPTRFSSVTNGRQLLFAQALADQKISTKKTFHKLACSFVPSSLCCHFAALEPLTNTHIWRQLR